MSHTVNNILDVIVERMNHIGSSVNLHIVRDGKILLMRRISKRWMNGKLQIPGGHTEKTESPLQAMLREAYEELGIQLSTSDIKYLATVAVKDGNNEYLALQFGLLHPENYDFRITEPDKCSELLWHDVSRLPDDTIDIFKHSIASIHADTQSYIEIGY